MKLKDCARRWRGRIEVRDPERSQWEEAAVHIHRPPYRVEKGFSKG